MIESLEEVLETNELEYEYIQKTDDAVNAEEIAIQEALVRLEVKERRIREAYENEIDTLEEYKQNKLRLKAERKNSWLMPKDSAGRLNSLLPRFQARKISCARLHMCMRFWQTQISVMR